MIKRLFTLLLLSLAAAGALAQARYPNQPVRWIVPYAAGGSVDTLARTLTEAMQPALGQTVVVDNRPGGSTNIAASALLQSKPDGYTVMQVENATLFFNEHLFAKLPYKPDSDLAYIGGIGRFPVMLVVANSFPAKTLAEFIAQVKAKPDEVNYASPGNGTMHHITMELIKQQAGLQMTHVPYKGGVLAMQDMVAGRVTAMVVEPTVALQFIRNGQLRPLALAGQKRIAALPDVPTFAELGMREVEGYTVHALVAPAGLPDEIARQLNADVQAALKAPKVQQYLGDSGFEPIAASPQAFKDMARAESARWGRVIKAAGIKLE
jgi:tripartite-type tricarboxylate transporter receptor subunit TctC